MEENRNNMIRRVQEYLISKKSIRYSTVTIVIVLVVLVLFVGINLIFNILNVKHNLIIDMTTQKMYTISDNAKEFIESLDKDVTITIVQDEGRFTPRTVEALRNYDAASDHITYQYVDLDVNPAFASSFQKETITDYSIIVQCGDKYQILEEKDLYYTREDEYYTTLLGIKTDQKLCSAIANVITEDRPTLVYTKGHGEIFTSELTSLFDSTNRNVEEISLLTQRIPNSADILVICEPSIDFDPSEIKKIEDFMDSGGKNLIIFMDAQVGGLEVLRSYLSEWGLSFDDNIIVDADNYWGGSEAYVLADYAYSSAIGESARSNKQSTVLPFSRSISIDGSQNELSGCSQFEILTSHSSAYAKPLADLNTLEKGPGDIQKSYTLAAGSTKLYSVVNGVHVESTVVIFGSSAMTANTMIQTTVLGNKSVILDALLYQKVQTDIMDIDTIYIKDLSIDITAQAIRSTRLMMMYIVPIAICALGAYVWFKRKKA